jgi:hypothetical protein
VLYQTDDVAVAAGKEQQHIGIAAGHAQGGYGGAWERSRFFSGLPRIEVSMSGLAEVG